MMEAQVANMTKNQINTYISKMYLKYMYFNYIIHLYLHQTEVSEHKYQSVILETILQVLLLQMFVL